MERFVFDGSVEPRTREKGDKGENASGDDRISFSIEIITVVICGAIREAHLKCVSEKPRSKINRRCLAEGRGEHKFRVIRSVPEKFFVTSAEMAEIRVP